MADQKISQLNSLTNSTIDVADVIPVVDTSANETKKITYQNLQNPTDTVFAVVDDADTTKKVKLQVSGVTTGTTRTLTVPDANTTIVGTDTTQTLTNKTLTSPAINVGSDATGDLYYRNSGGTFTRLPIGTVGQILDVSSGGIPEWIANPSASNGSTTVKGVYEEATQAEHEAGTTTGGTGADLIVSTRTNGARLYAGYAADAGSTDSYAITLSPVPSAYTAGMAVSFKANTVNTGTATLNVNSLGAKTIVKGVNTTLADGDIAAGQICTVIYDGTNFVLQNPVSNSSEQNVQQQYINAINTETTIDNTFFTTSSSGISSSNALYAVSGGSTGGSGPAVTRYVKMTNGSLYITHSVYVSNFSTNTSAYGICVAGGYLYVFGNLAGNPKLVRLELADLTNETVMTVSGTALSAGTSLFSDGTNLYNVYTAGSAKKYTISGTTATSGADTSFTSITTTGGYWSDGTNVYCIDGSTDTSLYKWALTGGARTTGTTIYPNTYVCSGTVQGNGGGIFKEVGNTSQIMTILVNKASGNPAGRLIPVTTF